MGHCNFCTIFQKELSEMFKFFKQYLFSKRISQQLKRFGTQGLFMMSKVFLAFLGKFGQKNQGCLFKMKFEIQTNLNMMNSMIVFIFFYFQLKISFLSKPGLKNQNFLFKIKRGIQTNLNTGSNIPFMGKFGPKKSKLCF